jgi:hypothetical protein
VRRTSINGVAVEIQGVLSAPITVPLLGSTVVGDGRSATFRASRDGINSRLRIGHPL